MKVQVVFWLDNNQKIEDWDVKNLAAAKRKLKKMGIKTNSSIWVEEERKGFYYKPRI